MYNNNLSTQDELDIRAIVERQLSAFKNDDIVTAFSLACPELQRQFGTPHGFVEMIKINYQPIYNPRAVIFEGIVYTQQQPTLKMMLMTQGGNLVRALCVMQQQSDLSWRMAGCQLLSGSIVNRHPQ